VKGKGGSVTIINNIFLPSPSVLTASVQKRSPTLSCSRKDSLCG